MRSKINRFTFYLLALWIFLNGTKADAIHGRSRRPPPPSSFNQLCTKGYRFLSYTLDTIASVFATPPRPVSASQIAVLPSEPFDRWVDPNSDFSIYQGVKSALFLSDREAVTHGGESLSYSLGERLHTRRPDINVVIGDVEYSGKPWTRGNKTYLKIDNSQPFPPQLKQNQFDAIVMRRGLCECGGKACCGGVVATPTEISEFFLRVGRVLNKKNPSAAAYLLNLRHGGKDVQKWKEAAAMAMSRMRGIEIQVLVASDGGFDGIRMLAKP